MGIRGNLVGTTTPRANLNQTNPKKADYVKGRESIVSIQTARIDEKTGELILNLSNGEEMNLGKAIGPAGKNGTNGKDGVGIADITFAPSEEDGGVNTITILTTDEKVYNFEVKNGEGIRDILFSPNEFNPLEQYGNIIGTSGRLLGAFKLQNGKDGDSVTVSKVTESTADGGSNVVEFSDGKTVTVKNGSKGNDGKTPVKGTDYFTETDKAEMIAEIKEQINTKDDITITYEEHPSGYFDSNIGWVSYSGINSKRTNLIPTTEGDIFTYSGYAEATTPSVEWYDANECLLGWESFGDVRTNPVSITTPDGVSYVRFYSLGYGTMSNVALVVTAVKPKDNQNTSVLVGKKIVYDGDSICIGTYGGGGYAKLIADMVGGLYENQAVGGAKLVTKDGGTSNYHSIVDNLANLPTDGDLYCFDGGVNDVWTSTPLGTYSMSDYKGAVDKTTICGALETIFRYCINNFVGKPVVFIIAHKVSNISYENYKNYHDSAIAICNKYSIPYYDAYNKSGLNGWNDVQNTAFLTGNVNGTPDGCHPNEEGYKRYYVPQLLSLFESVMPYELTNIDVDVKPEPTNILDEVGYEVGRLSTGSGELKTDRTDRYTTGYIPVNFGDTLYFKNIGMQFTDYGGHIAHYLGDKSFKSGSMFEANVFGDNYVTYHQDGSMKSLKWEYDTNVKFVRFCFVDINENSIITINEPID